MVKGVGGRIMSCSEEETGWSKQTKLVEGQQVCWRGKLDRGIISKADGQVVE